MLIVLYNIQSCKYYLIIDYKNYFFIYNKLYYIHMYIKFITYNFRIDNQTYTQVIKISINPPSLVVSNIVYE